LLGRSSLKLLENGAPPWKVQTNQSGAFGEATTGDNLTGVYRRMLTLNNGRFALIERSYDFALMPWRPVLEKARGQVVTQRCRRGWHFLVDR
jgi:Protein of unknown function (DUF3363)